MNAAPRVSAASVARPKRWWPEAAVLAAACLFGSTFKIVQRAVEDVTAFAYVTGRFTIAALVLLPIALRQIRKQPEYPWRLLIRSSLVAGSFLAAGYLLQTEGLRFTSASTSAFITGLSTLFVPVIAGVWRRQWPAPAVGLGIVVALVGLWILTGATLSPGKGEVLTLGCAVAYALWLLAQQPHVRALGAIPLAAGQMIVVAVGTAPMAAVAGAGRITSVAIASMVFTAIACAAIAVSLQLWAQRYLGSSRTALWLLTEPVFAGIVSWVTGEPMGAASMGGAAMILGGVAVSELGANDAEVDEHGDASWVGSDSWGSGVKEDSPE